MQPVNPTFEALVNNDNRYPVGRVSVYETTKSVPSLGFNASYYAIGQETDMNVADWWSGLPSTLPSGVLDEGTFLTGPSIVEESTIMAFDWGVAGVPPPISGRTDLWAARWTGYFFARYSGVYRFYMDSAPFTQMRMKFDGSYVDFEDADSIVVDRWAGSNFEKTRQELHWDSASLTAGQWYAIEIQLNVPKQSDPQNIATYMCMKYEEPDATTSLNLWGESGGDIPTDYQSDVGVKKVLSAGVVNTTNSFLSPIVVPGISGFSGTRRKGQTAEFTFTIRVPATTNIAVETAALDTEIEVDSVAGFPSEGVLAIGSAPDSMDIVTYTGLDTVNNKFTGVSGVGVNVVDALVNQLYGEDIDKYISGYNPVDGSFGPVKAWRLMRIEGGLNDGAGTDYFSDRIWGNLSKNPIIDRDNKTVTWVVRDFSWMLNKKFDRNYPNQASYSMASYYDAFTPTTPDGLTRPVCYDRWTSGDAVRDIFMLSGVDPVLLYQRERVQVSASPTFDTDYGRYLVSGDFILSGKPRYGHPASIDQTNPDDRYVWQFGHGTMLYENIAEIVRTFAYRFGFTPEGYPKSQPVGIPDEELIFGDPEITPVNTTATWTSKTSTGALSAFRAKYAEPDSTPSVGMKIQLAADYMNDLDLIVGRHAGASQVIKLKVGGVYQTSLIIDGVLTAGTGGGGDEFDITRSSGDWFFYDGIDTSGFNPAVIKIATPLPFALRSAELEVVSGIIRFNAFFVYTNSSRSTVRDIDETVMSTLSMEKDIDNQRNDIVVIGALQGLAKTIDGQTINPNNPIYIHTVSRATDLGSIYDSVAKDYIGHIVSTEIYDERILDQERADEIAIFALKEYREQMASGSTALLFDPRLDILDSIGVTDKHTRIMAGEQAWINAVSEVYAASDNSRSYTTTIGEITQREPLVSARFKPEPDLSDWGGEPVANIAIFYRGYRATGNDSSQAGRVITIGADPGWPVDHWISPIPYFISDETGHLYEIESNTSDTITLVEFPEVWEGVNWAITFDPLDSENGEPLDIRYDQIANGKVAIEIMGKGDRLIAVLNEETRDTPVNWGPNRRVLWNGEVQFGAREGRTDYLVSKETLFEFAQKLPMAVKFTIRVQNQTTGAEESVVIVSHSENFDGTTISTEPIIHSPALEGRATVNNPFGAAKIIPKVLDGGYYIGHSASGGLAGADNSILDAGRLIEVIDQGSGLYRLMVEGRGVYNAFSASQYNGKWVMSGKSGHAFEIEETGNDGVDGWIEIQMTTTAAHYAEFLKHSGFEGSFNLWRDGEMSTLRDDAEYPWLSIVENEFQAISFKQSDNDGRGLDLKFSSPEFWVENLNKNMFLSGIEVVSTNLFPNHDPRLFLEAKFKTICENELTIHHDGNTYTVPEGSDVKFAQFGTPTNLPLTLDDDQNRYESSAISSGFRSIEKAYQIYWSKYYPTKLWFSAGVGPDAHNPNQGSFVIAEVINLFNPNDSATLGDKQRSVFIRCPQKPQKAKSFVMQTKIEARQAATNTTVSARPRTTQATTDFEFVLPEQDTFVGARDLGISANPSALQQSDGPSESLYFWRSLENGRTPEKAFWLLLFKNVIFDRVGRRPLNLPDNDIFKQEDTEEVTSTDFTFTDWNALPVFWIPEAGFSSRVVFGNLNWSYLKFNRDKINLQMLLPIRIWRK
jgi:hypothetical protein